MANRHEGQGHPVDPMIEAIRNDETLSSTEKLLAISYLNQGEKREGWETPNLSNPAPRGVEVFNDLH